MAGYTQYDVDSAVLNHGPVVDHSAAAEHGSAAEYIVPTDPMDSLHCDSCQ